jgi:HK97 family phage portal protein
MADTSSTSTLCSAQVLDMLLPDGYIRLSDCPEVQAGLRALGSLIGSMTIHLMQNTKSGDVRIKNELSKKIDIYPSKYMNRTNFIAAIVSSMMLTGNCFVLPHMRGTMLDDLQILSDYEVSISDAGYGYVVRYRDKTFAPEEILHFAYDPDPARPWRGRGLSVSLRQVAKSLAQARKTSAALMSSPAPSVIVKVDGLTEEFQSKKGRLALAQQYIDADGNGLPWFIPAEAFDVVQVKPLTLEDLAIPTSINLDKRTVAAIIGVTPFILGADEAFNREEYNNYVQTKVLPIALLISQELTKKLLYSPDWYFRFNPRSMFSYALSEIADVSEGLVDRAIITRNEARDWLGFAPREGLDELTALENYIPLSELGKQKKLIQEEVSKSAAKQST